MSLCEPVTCPPATADSELRVWRLSEGRLHELLVVSELGAPWKRFDVNITSTEEYQVGFSLCTPSACDWNCGTMSARTPHPTDPETERFLSLV